jgi:tetratricopeptide (TPR) repeat protein
MPIKRFRKSLLILAALITSFLLGGICLWPFLSPLLYQQRAAMAFSQGRTDYAIHLFSRALAVDTVNKKSQQFYGRALAYAAKGDIARAMDDLNHAIEKNPPPSQRATILRMRSLLEFSQCDLSAAMKDVQRALEFAPPDSQIESARATMLLKVAGDYKEAMNAFDRALEIAKRTDNQRQEKLTAEVLTQRGDMWVEMGQYELALPDFTSALDLGETPDALQGIVVTKLALQDCPGAELDVRAYPKTHVFDMLGMPRRHLWGTSDRASAGSCPTNCGLKLNHCCPSGGGVRAGAGAGRGSLTAKR